MIINWLSRLFGNGSTKNNRPSKPASRSKRVPARTRQPANTRGSAKTYSAVTVHGQSNCCDAAKRLSETKFLAAHAPTLPLGGCTQANLCKCRYRHHQDRRQDYRRDEDHGLPSRIFQDSDRRNRRDRRKTTLRVAS